MTDTMNLIINSNFNDDVYWQINGEIDTSPETRNILNLERSLKTSVGNGTPAQQTKLLGVLDARCTIAIEPQQTYLVRAKAFMKRRFTGKLELRIYWYDAISGKTLEPSVISSTDYRTAAKASADSVELIESEILSPTDAGYAVFSIYNIWSTTLNNREYALIGEPWMESLGKRKAA